jgi:hypothetical protein
MPGSPSTLSKGHALTLVILIQLTIALSACAAGNVNTSCHALFAGGRCEVRYPGAALSAAIRKHSRNP